ncbi:MAG: hypothetical protein GY922_12070 [Proteobacteria bacterium]|nr:hypothetical protein [Pseudomonadota bacterium]
MPITINFSKAQELTKTRLREEREPLLKKQDVAYMRAQETGEDTSSIVVEKQRLRDLPELADSASTLDELKNLSA